MFQEILTLIARLRVRPAPACFSASVRSTGGLERLPRHAVRDLPFLETPGEMILPGKDPKHREPRITALSGMRAGRSGRG